MLRLRARQVTRAREPTTKRGCEVVLALSYGDTRARAIAALEREIERFPYVGRGC
jgi:hypothetical protein